MPSQDMIAIGGSAGGMDALITVLKGLPSQLGAAVFVVLHVSPESAGVLPQILSRSGNLPADFPNGREPIEYGRVYVAPPDHHLLVVDNEVQAISGPRENGFRPAIDPLFRSVANAFGPRSVGIVLSGALDDGTFGLLAIKKAGGVAIVQHPYEARLSSMPLSAIQNVEVDHIVRCGEMAPILLQLVDGSKDTASPPPARPAKDDRDVFLNMVKPDELAGPPSLYSCPECGGTLWEFSESGLPRFRCHTGHGFTPDTLLSGQNGHLEHALWSAVRVLKERAALHRQIAARGRESGQVHLVERYLAKAEEEDAKAATIEQLIAPEGQMRRKTPFREEQ